MNTPVLGARTLLDGQPLTSALLHQRATGAIPTEPPAEGAPTPPSRWGWTRPLALALLAGAALGGLYAWGAIPRLHQEHALANEAAEVAHALPPVTVAKAERGPDDSDRTLPGTAQPDLSASIYARTNGYVKRWLVDIGDRVEEGQLLAEIDAPEIDAQLAQARAAVVQAQANLEKARSDEGFARGEEHRYRRLGASRAVSTEDYESKVTASRSATASVSAMEATIKVNEANVKRLEALASFQKLTAPFAGVITARNIDPGDLVTADNPAGGRSLFKVEATDPLRVLVDVPQVFSTAVKPGLEAVVYRKEDPAHRFTGRVTRTASALDPNTRTLRTEVQVANPDNALLPGMYLQVKFVFRRTEVPVRIPAAAVVTRAGGPKVAVLDGRQTVHYRDVALGRDFGAVVEVTSGLKAGESVVVHPGDDLPEGQVVEPVSAGK